MPVRVGRRALAEVVICRGFPVAYAAQRTLRVMARCTKEMKNGLRCKRQEAEGHGGFCIQHSHITKTAKRRAHEKRTDQLKRGLGPPARKCTGQTKYGGGCAAPAMIGEAFCYAHHPDPKVRAAHRETLALAAENSGGVSAPSPLQMARAATEKAAVHMVQPYLRSIGLEARVVDGEIEFVETEGGGAKLFAASKDGLVRVSDHDDLGAQMAAVEKLLDRVFGKPKQTTEMTGSGGGPIRAEVVSTSDRAAEVARILAEAGALPGHSSPHEGRRRPSPPTTSAKASNGSG